MFLGISFLGLAIAAVLLQAWLWAPQYWDEEKKKSLAPRSWTNLHRAIGFAYVLIYVGMMWHMVPRLWHYQFELPARTVVHAVAGILIGVILLTKLAILRFFRHFEEAMPTLGFGLLACTVVLTMLSVPFAMRAHDLGGRTTDEKNVARVREVLARLDFRVPGDGDDWTSESAFRRGREVLVRKCTSCHDVRTILGRPRSGAGWHRVVERMLDKPVVFGEAMLETDVPFVTSYLVAITPDLQRSTKRRRDEARARRETVDELSGSPSAALVGSSDGVDGEEILASRCMECHGIEEIQEHGGDSREGWTEIVGRMIAEEGAELSASEASAVVRYLSETRPIRRGRLERADGIEDLSGG